MSKVTGDGNIYLTERAAADADIAGDGQIWVDDSTPNKLMFTDDTGNDIVVADSAEQRVVQVVNSTDGSLSTGTTAIPVDNTIPQITEGIECLSLAITPKNALNILKIEVTVQLSNSDAISSKTVALFQDSTADAIASVGSDKSGAAYRDVFSFVHYMVAGTTSATTFTVRGGATGGTTSFNGSNGNPYAGGTGSTSITITEYTP
jgi:hypothetical protein